MSFFGRGRQEPTPQSTPQALVLVDVHPAQLDLMDAERRIAATVAQIDDCLARVRNGRPAMRDTLLDLRLELRTVSA